MINAESKFLIVGLGLLGGSYAKGLKQAGYTVMAIDINPDSIQYAKENGIIDDGAITEDKQLIEQADIIILGVYPSLVKDWINRNQSYFKTGCIITDVTGIKSVIVSAVHQCLRKDVEFIASHPMAGREVSGVQYANNAIFEKANFIITPDETNSEQGIETVHKIAEILRFGRISILSPQEHDLMIGYVSQLTHVIAVTLMNANDNTHLRDYTGDSFRDLTRIARINENLWTELFIGNKDVLLSEIDSFASELAHFRSVLENEDTEEMKRLFIQSTERRKLFDK